MFTYDLTTFVWSSLTNPPLTLSNLYPGLVITSSSNNYVIQYTTNYFAYYTNLIGAPIGSQTLVTGQTVTWALATNYYNSYANIVTNTYHANSSYTVVTVQAQQENGAPAGTIVTNTSVQTVLLRNVPSGDFYINTNACGTNLILGTLFTNVVLTTNLVVATTNTSGTISNSSRLFYTQTQYYFATNHILLVEQPLCGGAATGGTTTNAPGLYQGVGRIQFVPTSFDSLLGQFYQPITNTYSMHLISNSKLVNQTFQRVITAPDFLISAADLAAGPAVYPPGLSMYSRNVNFNQANVRPGLAGPGTIDPATTITLNKSGNLYLNGYPGNELSAGLPEATWGSFDGSTNAPVVYPDGTSIANLANEVLIQITPAALPNGSTTNSYSASFVATGGAFTPPFTWTIPSGGLPPGLTMSSAGVIAGTPTQSGTFDFTLQLTDVLARSVQWNYTLTIQ